jgi:hypothetical protein
MLLAIVGICRKITLRPSSAVPLALSRARATLVPLPLARGSAKER